MYMLSISLCTAFRSALSSASAYSNAWLAPSVAVRTISKSALSVSAANCRARPLCATAVRTTSASALGGAPEGTHDACPRRQPYLWGHARVGVCGRAHRRGLGGLRARLRAFVIRLLAFEGDSEQGSALMAARIAARQLPGALWRHTPGPSPCPAQPPGPHRGRPSTPQGAYLYYIMILCTIIYCNKS